MSDRNSPVMAAKPRYEILDGLRGVAAMTVVAFHLFETYSAGLEDQIINHGYLAVDFFFVLSGFVIGYAYDDRWPRMSLLTFAKRRLLRLHPLAVLGTLIGALLFYFGACDEFALVATTPWWQVLLIALWGCTLLPVPASLDLRGWTETNPLNGTVWTLQWEYLANALYALVMRRLSNVALGACVAAFGVLTVLLCLDIDPMGVLAARQWAAYTVVGGWSLTPDQLLVGATRLLYPFFAGLLLSRLHLRRGVRGGLWWCAAIVLLVLCMPRLGSALWVNGVYEAVCILVVFPLVVVVGAGSEVLGTRATAVNRFMGEISYPIYITHYPLIYMQKAWAETHAAAPLSQHVAVGVSVFVLAIAMAWASLRLYDMPVRRWLAARLKM